METFGPLPVTVRMSKEYAHAPIIPLSARPQRCAGCPYKSGPCVGSRGPKDSPFVIVGESPGSNELQQGYPFVGMSGEMLDSVLQECGWVRGVDPEPLILNALQCFPRNKDTDQPTFQGATRACSERLNQEVSAYPRKVILALGNAASWALTNNYGIKITQQRGKLYKHPAAEMGCVITVHPAFLMRNGTFFVHWKKDITYAIALLKGINPKEGLWAPPVYTVPQTREDYEEVVSRLSKAKYIAGDIETGGKDKFGTPVGLHFQKGYILCLGVTSDLSDGRHVDIIPGSMLWAHEDLTRQLLGNKARWIWQNGKFDVKFLRHEGIHEARVYEDTMLLSYALNENKGHDLDSIAWDWIGAPQHKHAISDWFKSQGIKASKRDYADVPTQILYMYNAIDLSKTYKVWAPLRTEVNKDVHSRKLYERVLIPGSEFLVGLEMAGMRLDPQRMLENNILLLNNMIPYESIIQEAATQYLGHQINIASPKQLQVLLYEKMRLGPVGSSTDEDALIRIQRKYDSPVGAALQKWRKLAKARGTYAKPEFTTQWPGTDDRVHITFNLHRTTTGRLSSSDPTNLQNWPRDPQIRGSFIPDEGNIYVSVDLNQAELRCLAIMSGDPVLLQIYTANEESIHHITSVALFGQKYTDDEKMRAKAVNFGIVYGRTAPSLAEEFNISPREAEEYIRAWLARYPVAAKFIEYCREAPNKQLTLITNFGQKKRWGVISYDNQRNSENEAANFPHQSSSHHITLCAGIETQPVIRRLWGARYVNEIHDDLMSEVVNDQSMYGPMIAYIQWVMQRTPRDWGLTKVPFLAEAKIGRRWGAKRNAKELGVTDEHLLDEYMQDFKPTEEHRESLHRMVWDKYHTKLA